MPELPEVETTVRGLRKDIVGKTIVSAWTDQKKPTKSLDRMDWQKRRKLIEGKKITAVTRRAKYIVITLCTPGVDTRCAQKEYLYIHQKMTGHLLHGTWSNKHGTWVSNQKGALWDSKNQHIRAMFTLDNGRQIALSDMRRFATITYVKDPADNGHIAKLGPEPLDISLANFHQLFVKKRGNLKPVLMDPHFIAGIGNIYADEILWKSGLHPLSRVENLSQHDYTTLFRNTKTVFAKAIKMGGSSVDDYRTTSGELGEFQNILNAYQRTGQLCAKKDGGRIERIVVGQRSTHFCSKHQRKI